MSVESLLVFLLIGGIAGWLAGLLIKGGGYGILGNSVIGIVGAVVGGSVFNALGIYAGGIIGSIVTATVGAILLLFLVRLIKRM
ncbi:GlsB/YeaQ/YmgE family stress response membrane protein [Litorivivens sp.]|uniref:GlsB/YeaQ/YmgE family stress response membrane protein n=1 Tax=Litorivivens sp. TaxID=2020868 RepID=UPI00356412F1